MKKRGENLFLQYKQAFDYSDDPLVFLLELNEIVAGAEATGEPVVGPGLPPAVKSKSKFVTPDCISMSKPAAKAGAAAATKGAVA